MAPPTRLGLAAFAAALLFGCGFPPASAPEAAPHGTEIVTTSPANPPAPDPTAAAPSYRTYDDIQIDGPAAYGKIAKITMRRMSVGSGEVTMVPCTDDVPKVTWVTLSFGAWQRDMVRTELPDEVCSSVTFVVTPPDLFGFLRGTLVSARRADAQAEPWERVADQREGVRFELPSQPLRMETGYSLVRLGSTYEVEFEDVPEAWGSGGRVPDRFIAEWARAHGSVAAVQRSGSQSGVETRDLTMLKHGSLNRSRIFWRPERRRMIVVGVTGNLAGAERFFDSVTFF